MPNKPDDGGDVIFGFVCGRGRVRRCSTCGRPSTKLCDWPLTGKPAKTCDRPICTNCARHIEPDTDYCPAHARLLDAREKSASERRKKP